MPVESGCKAINARNLECQVIQCDSLVNGPGLWVEAVVGACLIKIVGKMSY